MKKDSVCVGIVVNHLTVQQLESLSVCFAQLPKRLEIVLIGYLAAIPAVFYQVPGMSKLEEDNYHAMKKELFWSIGAFSQPVIPCFFRGTYSLHVLDKLLEIDYLIGQGLDNAIFARKWKDKWIGSPRRWIESNREDEAIQWTEARDFLHSTERADFLNRRLQSFSQQGLIEPLEMKNNTMDDSILKQKLF